MSAKILRKNIDLDNATVVSLKILAAKAGKDLKNYIQDILKDHAKQVRK